VLERPVGLPPSLLKKAEEVRMEDGVVRIETSIENVQTLAEGVKKLLNDV
jgi:programmed cell death 6-interacting protein